MRYNRTIAIYGKYGKEKGNMLKNWNKPRCPEEEELLTRLKAARERLTVQQMQIKEKKLPVLFCLRAGEPQARAVCLAR